MSANRIVVQRADANQTLAAILKNHLGLSWSKARATIEAKRVRVNGVITTDSTYRLTPGKIIELVDPTTKSTPRPKPVKSKPTIPVLDNLPQINLLYLDDSILIVDKPAGLTTMRHAEEAAEFGKGKRFLPKTLQDLLPTQLSVQPGTVRAVHRLDRDTTGLLVFARTSKAEKNLTEQFRLHTIERRYLALVRGTATSGRIESIFVEDRGDGRRGSSTSTEEGEDGQRAVTHLEVLERFTDFSFVGCRLETGRTHQVRIHLGERGTPLCGERVYDRPLHGAPLPDGSGAKRPMLHATILGLNHPETNEWMRWESPLPEDMRELLKRFRE